MISDAALFVAGPTLAPTNTAAEMIAAKAAATLFDTFENIFNFLSESVLVVWVFEIISEDANSFAQAVPVFDICLFSDTYNVWRVDVKSSKTEH